MTEKKQTKEQEKISKKESSEDKKENKIEVIKRPDSKKQKESPKIDEEKFRDVFVNINSKSPSLEQVAVAPKTNVSLETNLANAPIEKKGDEIKYNTINYNSEDKKTYEENIKHNDENLTINTNLQRARDNPNDFIPNENKMHFNVNPELVGLKDSYEENMKVKSPANNFEEFKTHDPFQKVKKEYEFR